MSVVYLVMFNGTGRASDGEISALRNALATTHGLARALIHVPTQATSSALYTNVHPTPALALQIYFSDIGMLEAYCGADGPMRELPSLLPSLASSEITHQAMLARYFAVPDPVFDTPNGELPVSNLVTYDGPAEDTNTWLSYYIVTHAPIMTRLPGLRELEICMRIDWIDALPWKRMNVMQCNKVVFDSVASLDASHDTPVMTDLRTDYALFPPFTGGNSHFAMRTLTITKTDSGKPQHDASLAVM